MKKGCLARFLATVFFLGCLGLGYEVYSLSQANAHLTAELSAANLRAQQAEAQLRHRARRVAATPQAPSDWLGQAQTDFRNAEDALGRGDFGTARQDGMAAKQAMMRAPRQMSADAKRQVAQLQKEIASIPSQAVNQAVNKTKSYFNDL